VGKEEELSTILVVNKEKDLEVAALVEKTFAMITAHWRAVLPPATIKISRWPFNTVHELREFCEFQNGQADWVKSDWRAVQVVCLKIDARSAVVWVYYNRNFRVVSPSYYLQKELLENFANMMWYVSPELRQDAKAQSGGRDRESERARYEAFRNTFPLFFLNPKHLRRRKWQAWCFMERLDHTMLLKHQKPASV
jgi:hypothetical protein